MMYYNRELERELIVSQVTTDIEGILASTGITHKELAKRIGDTASHVSLLLSGRRSLTLRDLSDLAWGLGYRFDIRIVPIEDRSSSPAFADGDVPDWVRRRELEDGA